MTKIPTEVIELAKKGGYLALYEDKRTPHYTIDEYPDEVCIWTYPAADGQGIGECHHWQEVVLDGEFWVCLARALGKGLRAIKDLDNGTPFSQYEYWWQYNALRFADLILSGQDPTEFWQNILSAKDN